MINLVFSCSLVKANPRPETSIGISVVRKKMPRYSTFEKKSRSGGAQSEFNGQFMDEFNKNKDSQLPLLDRSSLFMDTICISWEGVTKLLKGLNPSKA